MYDLLIWLGIVVCVSQSATFSGLNLAMFGVSRLRLEVEASSGSKAAKKVLALRDDSNFLLTTILWGNVGINCLLTLLSDSVLVGITGFLFSTVAITIFGEILPQAYFSRNALAIASFLSPVLRFYQILLYPVAKPSALLVDALLGQEGIQLFQEKDLRELIQKHIESDDADVDRVEGLGALNFLSIDDLLVSEIGEDIDPASVLTLPADDAGKLIFPEYERSPFDPFLQLVQQSAKKWVTFTNPEGEPKLVLDSDGFLRDALFSPSPPIILRHCHRPIVIRDLQAELGTVIDTMKVRPQRTDDHVIDHDIILVWAEARRIITGADLLGHLMRGIVPRIGKLRNTGTPQDSTSS